MSAGAAAVPATSGAELVGVPARRSPRQQRSRRPANNREAILDAALEVFGRRGYAQTTLEAIARIVGMTRPGVLHHFASKEALFAEVIHREGEWALERVQGANGASGLAGLRALRAFAVDTDDNRRRLRLVHVLQGEAMSGNAAAAEFAARRLRQVKAHILTCLQEAVRDGDIAPIDDLDALAMLMANAVNGLQAQWLLEPGADAGAAFDALLRRAVGPREHRDTG